MKNSESKYKNIEMGIVGEPIIGSTSRIGVLRKEARRADHKGTPVSDHSYVFGFASSQNQGKLAQGPQREHCG